MSKSKMDLVPYDDQRDTDDDEIPQQITYAQARQAQAAAYYKEVNSSAWAKVDSVYWSSAIFSRPAMRVSHIMAHRFGERKALGAYRVIATILMTAVTAFLTLWQVTMSNQRPWFTMVWWVCAGTTLFFMSTLASITEYFSEEAPNARRAVDGASPFYSWKVCTYLFSFFFQASLHLVLLQCLNAPYFVEQDIVEDVLTFTPFTFLLADWFANRLYAPLVINAAYGFVFYALAALAWLLLAEVETLIKLPELRFLELQQDKQLGLMIPLFITIGSYLVQRFKFWYLSDGDLQFDYRGWAQEAKDRVDYTTDGGAKDEETVHQKPKGDKANLKAKPRNVNAYPMKQPKDESDFAKAEKAAELKGRIKMNIKGSERHQNLTKQANRAQHYLKYNADARYQASLAGSRT